MIVWCQGISVDRFGFCLFPSACLLIMAHGSFVCRRSGSGEIPYHGDGFWMNDKLNNAVGAYTCYRLSDYSSIGLFHFGIT